MCCDATPADTPFVSEKPLPGAWPASRGDVYEKTTKHPPVIFPSACSDEWSCAKTELAKRDATRRTARSGLLVDGETVDESKRIDVRTRLPINVRVVVGIVMVLEKGGEEEEKEPELRWVIGGGL